MLSPAGSCHASIAVAPRCAPTHTKMAVRRRLQTNAKTPPAFLVHGIDDKAVPVSNSDDYAAALKKAGVEVEYVRAEHGAHGFGLRDFWTGKCVEWLRKIGF